MFKQSVKNGFLVDNILIKSDVISEYYACDLTACKGYCCKLTNWGGQH